MSTISAKVDPRILSKADRLFTGTLEGRVIEILQNARRAGATRVEITNRKGVVTVRDNGRGIADFSKLLDLGASGWDEKLEASEDPAGVGLFCLAPRTVCIRSNGKQANIEGEGWTGAPVKVRKDDTAIQGTSLKFTDEGWSGSAVSLNAVFSGMEVVVDGAACQRLPFTGEAAVHHPELGCRIEVRPSEDLSSWHHSCRRVGTYDANVLVNFHGQVVTFGLHPIGERDLCYLIDLTGEPTDIRLMLPARTCLVENDGFDRLREALELEAYRYVQRRGHHRLPHAQYLRARFLGIELPEATPTIDYGLLRGESPEPIGIQVPEDWPLSKCYKLNPQLGTPEEEANIHLLAALGQLERPFVPVSISGAYEGYSWANIRTVDKVELEVGKTVKEQCLWGGKIICVVSIKITVHTSDGQTFSSHVPMAVPETTSGDYEDRVLVTRDARERLSPSEIWHHLGGYFEDGDTCDTQLDQFAEELNWFWGEIYGPDETLRLEVTELLKRLSPAWKEVTVTNYGEMRIQFYDGQNRVLPSSLSGGPDECSAKPVESESAEVPSV